MPPKKQTPKGANRTAGTIRTRQETLVDQVVAQVSANFVDKFQRLEDAMAAMIPKAPEPQTLEAGKQNKRRRKQATPPEQESDSDEELGRILVPDQPLPEKKNSEKTRQKPAEATAVRQTPVRRPDAQPSVNTAWKALISAQHDRQPEAGALPLAIKDLDFDADDDIQHSVNHGSSTSQR